MNDSIVEAVAEKIGKQAASDLIHEAIDEVKGRSSRTWGGVVALFALVTGAVIIVVVVTRRRRSYVATDESHLGSPSTTPATDAEPNAQQAAP